MKSDSSSKRCEIVAKQLHLQNRGKTAEFQSTSIIGRETFHQHIVRLYGEDTFKRIRTFEKLRTKKEKSICDLKFLLRCRDMNIVPVSHKLRFSAPTPATHKILEKASLALVRASISATHKRLNMLSQTLYNLHLELSSKLHPVIFSEVDKRTKIRAEDNSDFTTIKQKKKFEKLYTIQKQPERKQLDTAKVVINNSNHVLSEHALSALAKGFNFAVSPYRIPVEKIICSVESAILKLPSATAEQIRQDTAVILRKSVPPAQNMSMAELRALRDLKKNENIIVLPADKGNATVVLNTNNYKQKMAELLQDPSYAITNRDPTVYLEKKTRALIQNTAISEDIQNQIIPREKSSRIPKLYGLPKIHKEGIPLRPIVSAVNSPTQSLAKYLAKILQPFTETANSYVKNSTHFVELLSDLTVAPGDMLVSFDVVSLFTKVPVIEVLNSIESKYELAKYIVDLSRHCMESTYFMYDGTLYKQVEGAPMGSPLSPVIANLFMQDFENRALDSAPEKPLRWLRYVDDTFVIWQHGPEKLKTFFEHINNIHPNIKFTMEIESNNKLPFLDVLVSKNLDGSFGHTVYRKSTHTNRYLNAASHHHPTQIRSVANTLSIRSRRLSDAHHINAEARVLRDALLRNGYPYRIINKAWNRVPKSQDDTVPTETPISLAYLPYVKGTTDRIGKLLAKENIKTIFTTDRQISELLRNGKDHVPLEGKGVYEIPCNDCEQTYIGQTGRNLSARRQEHQNAVKRKISTSSLVQHTSQKGHKINFDGMRSISSIEYLTPRLIREAIEIEKRPHNMNKRDDSRILPVAWKPVISSLTKGLPRPKTGLTAPVALIINNNSAPLTQVVDQDDK